LEKKLSKRPFTYLSEKDEDDDIWIKVVHQHLLSCSLRCTYLF
jgi:hypothetical protein